MNDHITSLINTIAYKGLIKHDTDEGKNIQNQYFEFNDSQEMFQLPWLKEVKLPERKIVFINTDNLLNKTLQK